MLKFSFKIKVNFCKPVVIKHLLAEVLIRKQSHGNWKTTSTEPLPQMSSTINSNKNDTEKENEEEETEELPDVGFMRILKMNKPEWFIMMSMWGVTISIATLFMRIFIV